MMAALAVAGASWRGLRRHALIWLLSGGVTALLGVHATLAMLTPGSGLPPVRDTGLAMIRVGVLALVALGACAALRDESRSGRSLWLRGEGVSPTQLVVGAWIGQSLSLAALLLAPAVLLFVLLASAGLAELVALSIGLLAELAQGMVLLAFAQLVAPRVSRVTSAGLVGALFVFGHLSAWLAAVPGLALDRAATLRLLLGIAPKLDRLAALSRLPEAELMSGLRGSLSLTGLHTLGYVFVCLSAAISIHHARDAR